MVQHRKFDISDASFRSHQDFLVDLKQFFARYHTIYMILFSSCLQLISVLFLLTFWEIEGDSLLRFKLVCYPIPQEY